MALTAMLSDSSRLHLARCKFSSLNRPRGIAAALKSTVTPKWLKQRLSSNRFVVLDARSKSAYSRAHIPGSRNADLFHYFVPGTDRKNLARFHEDLRSTLGRLGLTGHERTVVYESRFGMRAPRVSWMLAYAGLRNPLLLEGGFRAWLDSKYPVERTRKAVLPVRFTLHPNPGILATATEVRSLSASHRGIVLDVRSEDEFEGTENRDCCPRPGRVPGAMWFEWTNFLDGQRKFRSPRSIGKDLQSLGLHPNSEIAVYCHRGARAAAAFYALRSMDYSRTRNYVASWHEWSSKKNLPIERGNRAP